MSIKNMMNKKTDSVLCCPEVKPTRYHL